MLHDRSLTPNSLQLHHSWANEIGGHSYDSRHGSSSGFEENKSDGYGVGFESDVSAILSALAAEMWSERVSIIGLESPICCGTENKIG